MGAHRVAAEHERPPPPSAVEHRVEVGDELRVSITRALRGGIRLAVAAGVVERPAVPAAGEQLRAVDDVAPGRGEPVAEDDRRSLPGALPAERRPVRRDGDGSRLGRAQPLPSAAGSSAIESIVAVGSMPLAATKSSRYLPVRTSTARSPAPERAADVGLDVVADHRHLPRGAPQVLEHRVEEAGGRLADDERLPPARVLDRGDERPGVEREPVGGEPERFFWSATSSAPSMTRRKARLRMAKPNCSPRSPMITASTSSSASSRPSKSALTASFMISATRRCPACSQWLLASRAGVDQLLGLHAEPEPLELLQGLPPRAGGRVGDEAQAEPELPQRARPPPVAPATGSPST